MKDFENIDLSFDPTFSCTNIRYDITTIIQKLIDESRNGNIASIKRILLDQHELVFKYDNLVNSNRLSVQILFTDEYVSMVFLNVLESVIGLINLSLEEITFINKIVYDFFEYSKSLHYEKENEIKQIMLSITYNINKFRISSLTSFIGINNANILSILSFSSFIDEKIVHRVNDFVITNLQITNIMDLTYMYNIMFNIIPNSAGEISKKGTNYIIHSMLEYWDANSTHNEAEYKMFQNISLMILNILTWKTISYSSLMSILKEYGNTIKLLNIDFTKIRFSLEKLARVDDTNNEKLKKINTIIKDFEIDYDIFIP